MRKNKSDFDPLLTFILALLYLAFLALTLTGCGYLTNPTAPTANSTVPLPILVWHDATPEEIVEGNALWLDTAKCLKVQPDLLRGTDVWVLPGPFFCGKVWAAGCTDTWPRRIRVSREFFRVVLSHEFVNMTFSALGNRFPEGPDGVPLDDWTGTTYGQCDLALAAGLNFRNTLLLPTQH